MINVFTIYIINIYLLNVEPVPQVESVVVNGCSLESVFQLGGHIFHLNTKWEKQSDIVSMQIKNNLAYLRVLIWKQ